jgi:uncharacterized protein YegL
MKQVLKNHIAILLDTSGSMDGLLSSVVKVFNNQIEFLRKSSLDFEQETRVSVYEFNDNVKCLISDVDVARPMTLQTLRGVSTTAMFDAVGLAVKDLQELPQKYGDHSFLIYLLTDGYENSSIHYSRQTFAKLIDKLPSNFSIAAFAPDNNSIQYLKQCGIPEGNIDKWDTTIKGVEEIGHRFEKTMTNYYVARSHGTKTFSTIFSDLNKVTVSDVKNLAKEIKNHSLIINEGLKAIEIRDLVERKTGIKYTKGCAFYELVKNETVQPSKEIAVQHKSSGKVYAGKDARVLLNLPDYESTRITPQFNSKWNVYVQSLSVNRKVIPKQRVLVVDTGY